jgi:hypothetical protein
MPPVCLPHVIATFFKGDFYSNDTSTLGISITRIDINWEDDCFKNAHATKYNNTEVVRD